MAAVVTIPRARLDQRCFAPTAPSSQPDPNPPPALGTPLSIRRRRFLPIPARGQPVLIFRVMTTRGIRLLFCSPAGTYCERETAEHFRIPLPHQSFPPTPHPRPPTRY